LSSVSSAKILQCQQQRPAQSQVGQVTRFHGPAMDCKFHGFARGQPVVPSENYIRT
jgi:hypothetical protein